MTMGHHDGFEKEPKQPHGPKIGGKHPTVHSHGMRPKRAIKAGGKKRGKRGL